MSTSETLALCQQLPVTNESDLDRATLVFPSATRITELHLVKCLLRMLQGFTNALFRWDTPACSFVLVNSTSHIPSISISGLHNVIARFVHASNCLKLVEVIVGRLESCNGVPTLRAFGSAAHGWLQRLRGIALKEECKVVENRVEETTGLMYLSNSLSSLCSAAEYLLLIVNGSVPQQCFNPNSGVTSAEIAVHILDHLYKKLDEVCLVQHGEDEACQMLLYLFVGSVLPYIQGLDTWLFEGILDDPFDEMFFFANKSISANEPEFWENSYQLRHVKGLSLEAEVVGLPVHNVRTGERDSTFRCSSSGNELNKRDMQVCPVFLKDVANSIISAGKSLQLLRHVNSFPTDLEKNNLLTALSQHDYTNAHQTDQLRGSLTLCEIFCLSVAGLVGYSDHVHRYITQCGLSRFEASLSDLTKEKIDEEHRVISVTPTDTQKAWHRFLVGTLGQRKSSTKSTLGCLNSERKSQAGNVLAKLCVENPVIAVCRNALESDQRLWKALNLSSNFHLPPLNDKALWEALLDQEHEVLPPVEGSNYASGFQYSRSECLRLNENIKMLESIFPFSTLLPPFQENARVSDLLPSQNNNTLTSRVLDWIGSVEPRMIPLPTVFIHECLLVYVKKLVDNVGRIILCKLMNDWRLIDELAVLRAVYLLGSGDLLQHFFTTIFNKLNKGETWDDDYELNTILQESICNSADSMLFTSSHSLIVSIQTSNNQGCDESELSARQTVVETSRLPNFGIDSLESLKFEYEVPWPLELIVNREAVKKYNQVMKFLLKVKRAKFVLDKTRRWLWKGKVNTTTQVKHHWLVQQKLLHFVDAFHQYVMDRVYHSAWRELCEGMTAAGSLDEVIQVHEAYLLSIQRQCFVVPDKLCTLIGIRINSILGLALEFFSVQQTLSTGVAAAMMTRCEMEIHRIAKSFDECVAFLLRVLSPRLNASLFPQLSDLVTRINYNYFYMSESGSLRIATGKI